MTSKKYSRAIKITARAAVSTRGTKKHFSVAYLHFRRYATLLTADELNALLHEIDLEANEMLESIVTRLATERGINEELKARDMLRWGAEMNNIKATAEKILLQEVVYV